MSDDPLKPGGALEGSLFRGFLRRLGESRELEPGDRIGAWRIICELGRGGTGVVFLAERADGAFSQQVALKWLRADRPVPGGREALARERELLSSLDHPNIARLVDGGETEDGMLWFAMDHVDGETIDRHAKSLASGDRLRLVRTLCHAVHHAHRRGLIHGDIKPSNVVVDERGRPRLVDFGISRIKGAATGASYGLTPDYASPEQRRRDELTTASDIWQLGRLLDDLAGGSGASRDLRAIIERATADSPEDRYFSAAAMGADIDAWLDRRPVTAHRGGAGYRFTRFIQRNLMVSAVTGSALAIIIGGGAWMALQVAEERDTARAEAARAETALAETEAALARAEALRDFLIHLFEATRPDRPRDQLPTTGEILAEGAERAMDPASAPPEERFGMLSTIGRVYKARALYENAQPLLEEALSLARRSENLKTIDLARALEQRAELMIVDGEPLEDAEKLLFEAEALLADVPDAWETLVRVRITRTWVERHRGRHDRALGLVEPLWWQMPPPGQMSASVRAGLLDSLAGLHAAVGNLERASRLRTLATAAFLEDQGEDGQGFVVSLANSVGLEFARGHLDEAERRARRAIGLYDRIYEEPRDYRASLRRTLARVLLAQGRIDEAFDELERSGNEYAAVRDMDEWPLFYTTRGHFNARLGHDDTAVTDLERGRDLLAENEDEFDRPLSAAADLLLAWALCRRGEGRAGRDLLESLGDERALFERQRYQAQWHEARATCRFENGRGKAALEAIDQALAAENAPGNLVDSADRRLLRARIMATLDRPEDAEEALARAEQHFASLGVSDHPLRDKIHHIRRELP